MLRKRESESDISVQGGFPPNGGTPHGSVRNGADLQYKGFQEMGDSISARLELNQPPRGTRRRLLWLAVAGLLCLGIATMGRGTESGPLYRTETAARGPLEIRVTATGRLEPKNSVEVGSEVSGTIESVLVDFNEQVSKDQLLAKLDTEQLEAQVLVARAAFDSAKAKLLQAQATVFETNAKVERLKKIFQLSGGKTPSKDELESAEAARKRAVAEEASAQALISEAEAKLKVNETSLSKAAIVSPIDGVVLQRQVEPGQTVAASLTAPILFTIAEDLRQLELQVDVDEADVGHVLAGQQAEFTVDAYPTRSFSASINQVRYAPLAEAGVVTYKTILTVENPELLLRPGMTATADILVASIDDALLVPNAAIRFTPPPRKKDEGRSNLLTMLLWRGRSGKGPPKALQTDDRRVLHTIWVLRDGEAAAVEVELGRSDGRLTEVLSGLEEGEQVIVGVSQRRS